MARVVRLFYRICVHIRDNLVNVVTRLHSPPVPEVAQCRHCDRLIRPCLCDSVECLGWFHISFVIVNETLVRVDNDHLDFVPHWGQP